MYWTRKERPAASQAGESDLSSTVPYQVDDVSFWLLQLYFTMRAREESLKISAVKLPFSPFSPAPKSKEPLR